MKNRNRATILLYATKIFFIGLVIQFIVHTFVTYTLGRDNTLRTIIRAWKEIWIFAAIAFVCNIIYQLYKKNKAEEFVQTYPLKKYTIIVALTTIVIVLMSLLIHKTDLVTTIMSLRYSMTGFVLFIIGFTIALVYKQQENNSREKWYIQMIKYLLIAGIIRRRLIYFLPAFIELFGYNKYIYEGQVGMQPPAVYYSNITEGMVRNQFLFERPIHRGMFLVVFWPLFFLLAIKNKSTPTQILRGSLYGLNILSTLSRAALIARIIQTILLLAISQEHNIKKLILYGFLPALVFLGGFVYRAKDDLINRNASNLGHIKHTLTAINKVGEKPLWGRGPGSAGPASHHRKDIANYNPENQYLQIWIEYGILGFLGWIYLYLWVHIIGYRSYRKLQQEKLTKEQRYRSWIVIGCSLGLLGLSIEGFFLHSFVDRMIVYPIMLLFGICFAIYYKHIHHAYKTKREQ